MKVNTKRSAKVLVSFSVVLLAAGCTESKKEDQTYVCYVESQGMVVSADKYDRPKRVVCPPNLSKPQLAAVVAAVDAQWGIGAYDGAKKGHFSQDSRQPSRGLSASAAAARGSAAASSMGSAAAAGGGAAAAAGGGSAASASGGAAAAASSGAAAAASGGAAAAASGGAAAAASGGAAAAAGGGAAASASGGAAAAASGAAAASAAGGAAAASSSY